MGDGGCAEGEREKQTRIPDKWISLDWWEGKAPEKWPKDMGRQNVKSLPSEERGGGISITAIKTGVAISMLCPESI